MASQGKSGRAKGSGEGTPAGKKPATRVSHSGGGRFNLDSETTARLLLFGAVALVVAIAGGFLIFGYWYSVVRPRNRTVLQVADQKVSYEAMKRRMSYEFLQNTAYQSQQGFQLLAPAAFQAELNELTEITQAGPRLGVTLDQSEFDQKLHEKLAVPATADQRAFADAFRTALDKTGLTESEFRTIARAEAFDKKILDKFKTDAPGTTLQSKVGVITTQTEDEAKAAIQRIKAGEDFSAVAKDMSKEPDAATTGGIKEYGPKGTLLTIYEDFAFSADIGAISEPLTTGDAASRAGVNPANTVPYYVVKVIDRSDQAVTDAQKSQIAGRNQRDWLKTTQDEMLGDGTYKKDWDDKSQLDAVTAIAPSLAAKLAAQAKKKQQDDQKAADVRSTTVAQLTASPPAAATTPAPDATSEATPASQGESASPAAPSQPVAPSNGQ